MITFESLSFGNGSITYVDAVAPRPKNETSETTGDVTVNTINVGTLGVAAYYEVNFILTAVFANDGVEFSNVFRWSCIVSEQDGGAAYRSVEDRAARQIAPMLRLLADKVEAGLPDFGESPKTVSSAPPKQEIT